MGLDVRVERKTYTPAGRDHQVLSGVVLRVPDGTVTCLYGPSGCGKSTCLRIAAGLDVDYDGEVTLDRAVVDGPTQQIGMVVQTHVAFDWLTVAGNLTFGMRYDRSARQRGWARALTGAVDRDQARAEAVRVARLVGLAEADLDKYPDQISGGMKQRMAFGRALVVRPRVLLLDEPFSSLDFESREALQETVLRVRDELGMSFVCVSHEPEEVLRLADEVVVLGSSPATVITRLRPAFSRGPADVRYAPEFQHAKQELRSWLEATQWPAPPPPCADPNRETPCVQPT